MNKISKLSCRKGLLFLLLVFSVAISRQAEANNVHINGAPELAVAGDSIDISFSFSWDNSWRDQFNWDAVWVFIKYKKEGATTAWSHVNLGSIQSLASGLAYDYGVTGGKNIGVFFYRNAMGDGHMPDKSVKIRVAKAELGSPTAEEIADKKLYVAVSGIEMVYIPSGPFYLGDGVSRNSFRSVEQKLLSPEDDIIGTDPTFTYSSIPAHYGTATPARAADRINYGYWDEAYGFHVNTTTFDISWIVNFQSPKRILTFGVTGVANYPTYTPNCDWYLLGSNDSLNWETLSRITPEQITVETTSYPVRNAIRVQNPGYYQYYRIYFPEVTSGAIIANIAMSEKALYTGATSSYLVESESVIMGTRMNQLYANDGNTWSLNTALNAAYPKGYAGFYCMKYEVSQEQYVSFLNMLDRTQQAVHIENNLNSLQPGEYVFGDKRVPSNRNGICVHTNMEGRPVIFANNLNPAEPYFGADDGQTLACNYLTPRDMLAYCDWAGLRPMSEMEYEKACRRPFPQYPTPKEYAWNNLNLTKITGGGDVSNRGTETETASGKNANAGNTFGPIRSGGFGIGTKSQTASGGGFWGVMEMSGNLSEIYYSAGNTGRAFYAIEPTYSHGNGVLAATGYTDVPADYWPIATTATNFVLRGGSFVSPDSELSTSDRSVLSVENERDSTITFRGGRTYSSDKMTVKGGKIIAENGLAVDTACPGTPMRIRSQQAGSITNGGGLTVKYMWYIDDKVIPDEMGEELVYDFRNGATTLAEYTVKRKTVTAVGEALAADVVKIKVPNLTLNLNPHSVEILYDCLSTKITVSSVQTGYTLNYKWEYAGTELIQGTEYVPNRHHFGGLAGEMEVECKTTIIGCAALVRLPVSISGEPVVASGAVTLSNCGNVLFSDSRDGRVYPTVKITDASGENPQCWMGKNVDVGEMVLMSEASAEARTGIHKRCAGNLVNNCNVYGGLYTWNEAAYGENTSGVKYVAGLVDVVQGICPDGWHFPSDEEWKRMEMNLGMTQAQADAGDWRGTDQGAQIMSVRDWVNGTNSSGFNALPGGYSGAQLGATCYWWNSNEVGGSACERRLSNGTNSIYRSYESIGYAFSVRCINNN